MRFNRRWYVPILPFIMIIQSSILEFMCCLGRIRISKVGLVSVFPVDRKHSLVVCYHFHLITLANPSCCRGISRYFPSPNASIPVKHTRRQFSPSEDEGSKEMLDTNGSSENHKPEKDPPSKRKHQEDAEEPGIRPRKRAKKQQTQRSQRRNAK